MRPNKLDERCLPFSFGPSNRCPPVVIELTAEAESEREGERERNRTVKIKIHFLQFWSADQTDRVSHLTRRFARSGERRTDLEPRHNQLIFHVLHLAKCSLRIVRRQKRGTFLPRRENKMRENNQFSLCSVHTFGSARSMHPRERCRCRCVMHVASPPFSFRLLR